MYMKTHLENNPLSLFAAKTFIAVLITSWFTFWVGIRIAQEISPYHQCTKFYIEKEGELRDIIHLLCVKETAG